MPASSIDRLQTPLRSFFLRKLSANFRPQGRVGATLHGQAHFRDRVASCCGIILIEANDNHIANHTVEISAETGSSFAATGGTPASGAVTGDRSWDAVDYAAASTVTPWPGIIPLVTPSVITATSAIPGKGEREVVVP